MSILSSFLKSKKAAASVEAAMRAQELEPLDIISVPVTNDSEKSARKSLVEGADLLPPAAIGFLAVLASSFLGLDISAEELSIALSAIMIGWKVCSKFIRDMRKKREVLVHTAQPVEAAR